MGLDKTYPIYQKKHASGNVGYRVDMGVVGKKRIFRSFPNREAAERFQKKCLQAEAKKKPADLRDLSEVVRHELLAAVAKLREHNATITQAVDFYLNHARPAKANATIGEVMDAFKVAKEQGGRSEKYITTAWDSFFVPFRDSFNDGQIAEITGDDCKRYIFKSKEWSGATRRTHLRHLRVLFNFAVKEGYAGYNPFPPIKDLKKPAGTSKKRVVSVENVIKLLRYALDHDYKQECAALVLVLFCGVRVDEVARLSWSDIKLDEAKPVIVLGEDQTKTGKGRINPVPPNAVAWLKPLIGKGKITPENYEWRMKYLRQKAQAGFKQNSARICFASYHLAHHEDATKTAFLLGHDNATLLYDTYKALVTKEAARHYWKITPDYDGTEVTRETTEEEIMDARGAAIARELERRAG